MRQIVNVLLFVCVLSVPAMAQFTTDPTPGEMYFPFIQYVSPAFGTCPFGNVLSVGTAAWCYVKNPSNTAIPAGVPIGYFASNDRVNGLAAMQDATTKSVNALAAMQDANTKTVTRSLSRLFSLVAMSAAIKDAIPNSGDRYAFRIGTGGFTGNLAGAVGFSVNLGRATRFSLNYGRAKSEDAFSGGINISIH